MLHEGAGELQTITGVELLRSHHATREDGYRLNVGMIGAEAMLRLFGEPEANERAFGALARFLDLLDETRPPTTRPALDPLGLSFQLKLLWLAGYLPHLTSCVECGAADELVAFSARAGGAVCPAHAANSLRLSPEGLAGIERLLSTPLADATPAGSRDRARRDALAVITTSYEEHGGFRLRTVSACSSQLSARSRRRLSSSTTRRSASISQRCTASSPRSAYWATGRARETQDRLVREAARVVGALQGGRQIGFCRAASDGHSFVYLADVYVLDEHRGRGLGEELVREMVENGPLAHAAAGSSTPTDTHPLYRKFGFGDPDYKVMERRSTSQASDSG